MSLARAPDRLPGDILWLDVDPSAEVSTALDALAPLIPDLEEAALADLLQVDDLPAAATYGSVHKISSVHIRAVEPEHERHGSDQSKTGGLSFIVVEMLVGPGWLLTCWHEPRTLPAGAEPGDRSAIRAAAMRGSLSAGGTGTTTAFTSSSCC